MNGACEMTSGDFNVLVADDDQCIRDDIAEILKDLPYTLHFAATAEATWTAALKIRPDLVLLDIKFPDCRDLSLLKRIKKDLRDIPVIIVSSQADTKDVVEAIRMGAYDYVVKPFKSLELRNRIENALSLKTARKNEEFLIQEISRQSGIENLIGDSESMKHARELIRKFADKDGCVLIQGESGTGKELAARALHNLSKRRNQPFVPINCASIPETLVESLLFGHKKGIFTGAHDSAVGLFEAARDGTIFLDEIGDMPLPQQASLLRVIEYRRFTPLGEATERVCRARFVFATNRDLQNRCETGKFREDLYYRIRVASIVMPPLRARRDDIDGLSEHYSRKLCAEMARPTVTLSKDALELLRKYTWPGNVRELRNVLESTIMQVDDCTTILGVNDFPSELQAIDEKNLDSEAERLALLNALKTTGGSINDTANLLKWHRNTVSRKMRAYGLKEFFSKP